VIDLLLGLVLIAYGVSGYRQGLLVSVMSLLGFLGGGALGMWLLPRVLERWLTLGDTDLRRVVVLVLGVIVLASVGQGVFVSVGRRLRRKVTAAPARWADALLGVVASVLAVCVLVWVIAGALRGGPSPSLSRAIGQSRIVSAIDQVVPASSGRVFTGFRALLDAEGFPRVFEGFGAERILPVDPPDPKALDTRGVRAAADSIVKVTGDARACDRSQEGTGWVLAPERVVTNAHVVAAVRDPKVRIGGEGRRYAARVVVFDPVRDLAVLAVPGLPAAPLRLGEDLKRGDEAVVAGFPLDGPYRLDSARVREVITARGEDIYGNRPSVRRVYSLFATVQPGNSGGPLLSASGEVVGVIFAKSLDDDATGYALTLEESEPVLAKGRTASAPVAVGACAAG
jgi:S1-C subfamily serine protease